MPTRVQTTGKQRIQAGASLTLSFSTLPARSNFILVQVDAWNANDNLDWSASDCTDNQGHAYALAVKSSKNGAARSAIFYLSAVTTSAGTFTITLNPFPHGGSYIVAAASEWVGAWTADVATSNTGSSTTPSTGTTGATAEPTELVAAVMSITANQASIAVQTVTPAWVQQYEELDFAYEPGEGDARTITVVGTQSCSWTCASTGPWTAVIATFKSTTAPGVPHATIGSTLVPIKRGTLTISEVVNGRNTMTCEVISTNGTYRPAVDEEVYAYITGELIFGGTVNSTSEYGITGGAGAGIFTRVNVNDFNSLADRRYVKDTLVTGTLKSILTTLVTNYLASFGVTLDAGQVNGPTLDELVYDYRQLTEVLNDLAALSGYVWEIDYSKVLRMYAPGTVSAPFNVVNNDGHALGDITVDQGARTAYANRIILRVGSPQLVDFTDTFTADGITAAFPLTWTPADGNFATYRSLVVSNNAAAEPVQTGGSPSWTYTDSPPTITRNTAPANGNTILARYFVQFPQTIIVEDTGEQALYGIIEKVIEKPDITSYDLALAVANAELAIAQERPTTVRYETKLTGLKPGQSQTITATARNINDTYLITEITSRDSVDKDGKLIRAVAAVQGTTVKPTWREVIKNWGSTGGATAAVAA